MTEYSVIVNRIDTYDLLFLRRNHADPLVVMPWRVWAAILSRVRP